MMAALQNLLVGGLHFQVDGFRVVYGLIAVWMWGMTTLFSFEYFKHEPEHLKRYWTFTILTFCATEGVMFSADLMTTFFFFEILSLTSFVWVIHEESKEAIRAAKTYFFIAVIGGLVLFMGLALLSHTTGTLTYRELHDAIAVAGHPGRILAAGICILLGFGAKAGMFPVHIWLPKSHPVAPSPASALLSGILTKVGIFGILMTALPGFFGNSVFGLIILLAGTVTMLLGAVLALFSINLKRTLACSSMSQIGFILVGIGTVVLLSALPDSGIEMAHELEHLSAECLEFAHSGIVLHMVNHSLIKLVLFMAAGVFVMKLGMLDLNEIRGYGRKKPLLLIPFALGALGISGVPLFNGYLSKTLLHEGLVVGREALAESAHLLADVPAAAGLFPLPAASLASLLHVIEWIFLFSGGLTFAYMLKLFLCVFVEKNPQKQAEHDAASPCMNRLSSTVLLICSVLMPVLGQPAVSGRIAALMTGEETFASFHAFSWANLSGGLISLGIGACVYLIIVRNVLMRRRQETPAFKSYVNLWPPRLDLEDLVYRPLLLKILPAIGGAFASVFANNVITKRAAAGIFRLGQEIARLFAENLILQPVTYGLFRIGQGLAAFFSVSVDGIILVSRYAFLRERVIPARRKHSKWEEQQEKAARAVGPLTYGFSFALLMTCLGILIVLGGIVLIYLFSR